MSQQDPDEAAGASGRPAQRRLTGPELEEQFDRWVERRRERVAERTSERKGGLARRIAAVLLGAVLVAVSVYASVQGRAQDERRAAYDARITQLESRVVDEQNPLPAEEVTADDLVALNEAAVEAASAVATKQQRYAELHTEVARQPAAGDGVPNDAALAVAAHRRELAPYFAEELFQIAGEEAYVWTTAPDIAPDRVDPRFEWYVRYDGASPSAPSASAWQVASALPSIEQPGTAEVIWECREDPSGLVLAWARATFDGATGVFTEFELVVTGYGGAHSEQLGEGD